MTATGAALAATLAAGCMEDRPRPSPVEPAAQARLSVQLLSPRDGLTVSAGADLPVMVSARDLDGRQLSGAGFVVRRFSPGRPTLDSAVIRFPARADSVHEFTFRVPADLPTHTQVDVYGVAFGPGTQARASTASSLVVVNCVGGVCR